MNRLWVGVLAVAASGCTETTYQSTLTFVPMCGDRGDTVTLELILVRVERPPTGSERVTRLTTDDVDCSLIYDTVSFGPSFGADAEAVAIGGGEATCSFDATAPAAAETGRLRLLGHAPAEVPFPNRIDSLEVFTIPCPM